MRYTFTERHIGRSLQENNFFCALYINLPFRLVGLSYAVEFLKDLGGDTREQSLALIWGGWGGGTQPPAVAIAPTTHQSKA